jgi:hypothetical protein
VLSTTTCCRGASYIHYALRVNHTSPPAPSRQRHVYYHVPSITEKTGTKTTLLCTFFVFINARKAASH